MVMFEDAADASDGTASAAAIVATVISLRILRFSFYWLALMRTHPAVRRFQ
jgi:hypothetical protein